ncbi:MULTISPECIES: hypothetical protein [Actinomycetes]|uniref:Uncharacterized protein n=2 Tax=Actinomycetes TaxID=1760 RepID=A0ABP6LVN6_9MICC
MLTMNAAVCARRAEPQVRLDGVSLLALGSSRILECRPDIEVNEAGHGLKMGELYWHENPTVTASFEGP